MNESDTRRPALGLSEPPPPQLMPADDRLQTVGKFLAGLGFAAAAALIVLAVVMTQLMGF